MGGAWRTATLFDLVALQRGYDITKAQQKPGSVPVVSSAGVSSHHDEAKAPAPGIVIGRKGTLGTVFFLNEPFWPHDTTLWVTDFKGNDPKFAFYFLKTMGLQQFDVGAANPTLNRNHIHGLPVHIPPIGTQRRIANILSAYDDLIENNTRRIKTLEEMARSLYREWFVEFRFPGRNDDKLVKNGDIQVPRGWRLARLGEVLELAYGKALKEDDRRPGDVKVYGSSGVVGCHDEALVQGPGIIVGRKGNVGAVHWSQSAFFPIDTVFFVRTKLPLRYVFQNLRCQNFLNNDAAVPGLNRNQAYSLPFVIPPDLLLERYEQIAEDFLAQAHLLEAAIAKLAAARDVLLPRLISGDIELAP